MLDTGVDLVLTGHEHLYQRTQPLAFGEGCPSIRPGRLRPRLRHRRGRHDLHHGRHGRHHPCVTCTHRTRERPYFAALSGKNLTASYGSLDVQVTADRLTASFVPVQGGTFTDRLVEAPVRVCRTWAVIASRARRPSGVGSSG